MYMISIMLAHHNREAGEVFSSQPLQHSSFHVHSILSTFSMSGEAAKHADKVKQPGT